MTYFSLLLISIILYTLNIFLNYILAIKQEILAYNRDMTILEWLFDTKIERSLDDSTCPLLFLGLLGTILLCISIPLTKAKRKLKSLGLKDPNPLKIILCLIFMKKHLREKLMKEI